MILRLRPDMMVIFPQVSLERGSSLHVAAGRKWSLWARFGSGFTSILHQDESRTLHGRTIT
ncbi:uncharacterized protein METZ01_LOCUS321009 [marine metagenome]|uniref:Uncharacterized protein n=1 Tax=marine metagenome TaxID=408172 RepID=A0A382P6C0_9ZZZZ